MPLLRVTADSLAKLPLSRLVEAFQRRHGSAPAAAEVRAWERSLPALGTVLSRAGLRRAEVLVEYQLPLATLRADAVVCGVDPRSGRNSYVVVELKQWTKAVPITTTPDLCVVDGLPGPQLTPTAQLGGYCSYLRDYLSIFEDGGCALAGAAYLHNASAQAFAWLRSSRGDDDRVFTSSHVDDLIGFLRERLVPDHRARSAGTLLSSPVRPSKELMKHAAAEIGKREQFVLLGQQEVAYSLVRRAVAQAHEIHRKEVIVVTGGPGSGKSVIALSLLGELSRHGLQVVHATGSRSFTTTLRETAGRDDSRVKSLFKYFNDFTRAQPDGLSVLLCDEAHRIRESSATQYTNSWNRTGRAQVDELIDAAKVPVFLLDERQVVRPGEVGTLEVIRAAAQARGLKLRHVALDEQFRNGGSGAYDRWVRRLLDPDEDGPVPWEQDPGRYELMVVDSPSALEEELAAHLARGESARMTAGFCWPWSEPRRDGTLVPDVRIGGWQRPWNVQGNRAVGTAPKSAMWATAEGGFGQIGCVYTAQGFEYRWNGVIFGPDLVRREGAWVAVRSASRDSQVTSKTTDEQFGRLIRNVYKVLLTRGLRGTVLYSTDQETLEFLKALVTSPGTAQPCGAARLPDRSGAGRLGSGAGRPSV